MTDYDYLFKILLVGNSGVGKSSLLLKFTENCFCDQHISTIGVDFKIHTCKIDDKIVKLQIWDTAGQERFRTITSSYYRGTHGIIIVYDITDKKSFNQLANWYDEALNHNSGKLDVIIVGNKNDLISERRVDYETAYYFAKSLGMDFIETSAKDSFNVEHAFISLAKKIKERKINFPDNILSINEKKLPFGHSISIGTSNCC